MFHFKFNIDTPWKQEFDSIWSKDFGRIRFPFVGYSLHKSLEMQFIEYRYIFGIDVDFSFVFKGTDHAGPEIAVSFFGYTFIIHIYDNRHWDHDNNQWEKDSEG